VLGGSYEKSHLQNCLQTEEMRQGTTEVVPQMAHSDFLALQAAERQTTKNK
jgi:hypothetical protein